MREACGLTQEELASELYVSRPGVANYERGERTPDVEMLQKLCEKFGVSMNYLLGKTSLIEEATPLAKAEYGIKPYLTKDGHLDLSAAPPIVKILIVDIYLYLMNRYTK